MPVVLAGSHQRQRLTFVWLYPAVVLRGDNRRSEVSGDEPCVVVDFGEIGDYAKQDDDTVPGLTPTLAPLLA